MTALTVREQCYAAVKTTLAAALTGVGVFRNRSSRVTIKEMPAIVVYDGPETPAEQNVIQFVTMDVDLEMFVTAADDESLGTALNDLYGRAANALLKAGLLNNGGSSVAIDTAYRGADPPVIEKAEGSVAQMGALFKFAIMYQQDSRDPTSFGA